MKPIKIKTFKCTNCKNIFPILKKIVNYEKLIDNRKYWHGKLVCQRCYMRYYYNRKLKANGIKEFMVGL